MLILCLIKVILRGKILSNDLKLMSSLIYLVDEIMRMLIQAPFKFMLLAIKIIL